MNSRSIVKWYFTRKYREEDPYRIARNTCDTRYSDMLRMLAPMHFGKALDIGCGEGMLSEMLLSVCGHVDGMDISEAAVDRARNKFRNRSHLRFLAADILKSELMEKYDLIVCAEVLYYLTRNQLRTVLQKISSGLNARGYLLIGNIKRIQSSSGFFRSHIGAVEINGMIREIGNYEVVKEEDRGGDILLLVRRRETACDPRSVGISFGSMLQ